MFFDPGAFLTTWFSLTDFSMPRLLSQVVHKLKMCYEKLILFALKTCCLHFFADDFYEGGHLGVNSSLEHKFWLHVHISAGLRCKQIHLFHNTVIPAKYVSSSRGFSDVISP